MHVLPLVFPGRTPIHEDAVKAREIDRLVSVIRNSFSDATVALSLYEESKRIEEEAERNPAPFPPWEEERSLASQIVAGCERASQRSRSSTTPSTSARHPPTNCPRRSAGGPVSPRSARAASGFASRTSTSVTLSWPWSSSSRPVT